MLNYSYVPRSGMNLQSDMAVIIFSFARFHSENTKTAARLQIKYKLKGLRRCLLEKFQYLQKHRVISWVVS